MRIGQAARKLGVSVWLLRAKEKEGVLPPAKRDLNDQRRYDDEDLEVLRARLFPQREAARVP